MGCPSEIEIGDNFTISVDVHDPTTGALTDADAVPTFRIYEDGGDLPIISGTVTKVDDTNTTGHYAESIAGTAGNGFENGKSYTVQIDAAVSGVRGGISYGFKAYDQRKSNILQLGSSTQSLTDLKDLVDTGYDPTTHKVQGVVLSDTCTTLSTWQYVISVIPSIPNPIDLTYNETRRISLNLTTNRGTLPSAAEITPGTIDIYRKTAREDPWTQIVTAGACSESDGIVYYDEVFDTTTGYEEKDQIKIVFKSISVVISGITYELIGADGLTYETYIRKTHDINYKVVLPDSIVISDTAVYKLSLQIYDELGITPVSAKITAGNISIYRLAKTGGAWVQIVNGAALSKADGEIYYNATFDSVNYSEGDEIRIVFYGTNTVTIGVIVHDLLRSGGVNFYTHIQETMRGTDSAALATVLGGLTDAAADGDPTSTDTLMQYTKQLVNVLVGTTGIVTFPSENAPSNNISLAEVIRAIYNDVTGLNGDAMRGTDGASTHTAADVVNEWETQSQVDPSGFHVNVLEVNGTAQTANDNGADINTLVSRIVGTLLAGNHTAQSGDSYPNVNSYLDATISSRAAAATALSTAIWTAIKAGYIDAAISSVSAGDATAANQTTMLNHLTGIKGATWSGTTDSLEAIRDRGDAAWLTGGGLTGSNTITITIQDGDSNNIVDAFVEVWDSGNTTFGEKRITNSSGQVTSSLDDGTYIIRIRKFGYTFTNQTLVVAGADQSVTYTGTSIEIGTPVASSACRVYDYAFMPDGQTPEDSLSATAVIKSMPEDAYSKLHSSDKIDATYDATTGLFYWDIVQGAVVEFNLPKYGYVRKQLTIPTATQSRLSDM